MEHSKDMLLAACNHFQVPPPPLQMNIHTHLKAHIYFLDKISNPN